MMKNAKQTKQMISWTETIWVYCTFSDTADTDNQLHMQWIIHTFCAANIDLEREEKREKEIERINLKIDTWILMNSLEL